MKAVVLAGYGESPEVVEVPEPVAGPGEVLVRVAGAAANPLDLKIAAGWMHEYFPVAFPYTLGTDVSGTVVGTGAAVVARTDPTAGGAFAELVAVPAEHVVAAPSSVALPVAAGIATAAATAWQALTEVAGVTAGQRVLVQAGAGGVGGFAVQFAKRLGAHVVATASPSGVAVVRDLGADEVVDRTGDEVPAPVDVVIDTVGGAVEERSLDLLVPGGLLVAVPQPPDVERAAARGLRAEWVFHSTDRDRLATVVGLVDDGVRVLVDRVEPLARGPEALAHLAEGHARGKVILAV